MHDDANTPIATPRASQRVTARELAVGNELLRESVQRLKAIEYVAVCILLSIFALIAMLVATVMTARAFGH